MSPETISALAQKILDSVSILKWPIFVALTVLGSLFTWNINPFGVFTILGRSPNIPPMLFLLWLLSGAFCLSDIVAWLRQYLRYLIKQHAEHRRLYNELQHHLTPDQKTILAQLLLPRHDRHYFPHNELITDLVQSGIIDQKDIPLGGLKDDPAHNYTARYLCILSPVARKYLEKHSYLLPKVEIENGTYIIRRKNTDSHFLLGPVEDTYGPVYEPAQKKQKKFLLF